MARDLGIPVSENDYYFISYNSEDAGRVAQIAETMHKNRIPIWYDKGIRYGEDWQRQIEEHIGKSKAVILFFTKGILQKNSPYVLNEYQLATEFYEKKVYVVFLDEISNKDVPAGKGMWMISLQRNQCLYRSLFANDQAFEKEYMRMLGVETVKKEEKSVQKEVPVKTEENIEKNTIRNESNEPEKKVELKPSIVRLDAKCTGIGIGITDNVVCVHGAYLEENETGNKIRNKVICYIPSFVLVKADGTFAYGQDAVDKHKQDSFLRMYSFIELLYSGDTIVCAGRTFTTFDLCRDFMQYVRMYLSVYFDNMDAMLCELALPIRDYAIRLKAKKIFNCAGFIGRFFNTASRLGMGYHVTIHAADKEETVVYAATDKTYTTFAVIDMGNGVIETCNSFVIDNEPDEKKRFIKGLDRILEAGGFLSKEYKSEHDNNLPEIRIFSEDDRSIEKWTVSYGDWKVQVKKRIDLADTIAYECAAKNYGLKGGDAYFNALWLEVLDNELTVEIAAEKDSAVTVLRKKLLDSDCTIPTMYDKKMEEIFENDKFSKVRSIRIYSGDSKLKEWNLGGIKRDFFMQMNIRVEFDTWGKMSLSMTDPASGYTWTID